MLTIEVCKGYDMTENRKGFLDKYRIVTESGSDEIEEKKSRFICQICPVQSEEETLQWIDKIKKKYWDARHNCYAYIIGKKQEIVRYSDNGEPAGTAGRPMLEVLQGEQLCDVAVVVTRYFGGTLLGTGGLVRAYTQAVQAGLKQTHMAWMYLGNRMEIRTDYTVMERIRHMLEVRELVPEKFEYGADVVLSIVIPWEETENFQKQILELSNGKAKIQELGEAYYTK